MGRVVSHSGQETVKRAHQRPSTILDVSWVADGMRQADVEEVKAQSGLTPRESWMLGRDEMLTDVHDKWEFLRQSRIHLANLHAMYPVLFNFVDARNTVHLRWLRWMGFTFISRNDNYGPEKRTFYEFVRI